MEDDRIVDLYLERNEAAIEETSKKYGKRLFSISKNIVRNNETAEECENDTYLRTWGLIPPNEPRTYLFAFLARIIRNISLNRCRDDNRLKRRAAVEELSSELEECLPSGENTEGSFDEKQLREQLNIFLEGLPKEKRNMFMRRYFYGDSIETIARRFGVMKGTARVTLFRLREKLREHLEKEGIRI